MEHFIFDKKYSEPDKPYNILSVCVFQMKKSYKKVDTYIQGLKYTAEALPKFLPNFYLRVYYDKSILLHSKWMNVLTYIQKFPRVQLVEFVHPWFVDNEGYHPGTFGTLVRLYPLFSKEDKNLNIILIGDVDFNNDMFPYWKNTYKLFRQSKSQVHMYERKCNHLVERVIRIVKHLDIPFSPYLNSFWSKIKFPYDILDNFLKCLHNSQGQITCKEIDMFINDTDYTKVKKANQMEKQKIMYGIDEICLLMMLSYVVKKKLPFSYHTFPDLLIPFREAYVENPNLVDTKEHKQILQQIMKKYYDEKKDNAVNYSLLYKTLNNYSSVFNPKAPKGDTEMITYMTNNLKQVYEDILSNGYKKYNLRGDLLRCASKTNFTGMKYIAVNTK